ncbi:glycosyltransferase family 2 protein [Bradyrhizobium sp. STM 3562]|uniref:glycosyltransferase family 2 protein n=1 Tax=Bradyrhizobium sp. STM 3562 TaxID=578924 RepID=UPI00388F1EB9
MSPNDPTQILAMSHWRRSPVEPSGDRRPGEPPRLVGSQSGSAAQAHLQPLDENPSDAPASPLVSVIMCVYNAGQYLRPSLLSMLSQTYQNLEIIIIDDGSTDGCFASVADLLTDPRVRIRRQQNATRPVALNRALDLVRGEFYAIQDGDDISHPARIEKQVAVLLKHPELAAVFCGNDLIMDERTLAPTFPSKSIDDCRRDIEAFRMPAHDPTGIFRMSLVGDFRYEPSLPFVEAVDYILRVGEQHPMQVLGECLYSYRIVNTSVTRRDPTKREQAVQSALRDACMRRGLEYDRAFPQRASTKSKNSVLDNNLAAHFIASVLDQRTRCNRWGALKTAWQCAQLHPFDSHYYKALVYAAAPEKVISLIRRAGARGERRRSTRHKA